MNKLLLSALPLCAIVLTSCQLEDNTEPVSETYTKAFIRAFGIIDSQQDWNLIGRNSITVKGGVKNADNSVEVFVNNGSAYQIAARYTDVHDGDVLYFDAPKGCNDFLVYANGQCINASNGDVVSLGGTRTAINTTTEGVDINANTDYDILSYPLVKEFTDILEDGTDNRSNTNIYSDYEFISTGEEITINPVYWNSINRHELGVYWYEYGTDGTETIKEALFYKDKTGDELQFHAKDRYNNESWVNAFIGSAQLWNGDCSLIQYTATSGNYYRYGYFDVDEGWGCGYEYSGYTLIEDNIRSKGFTIKLPKGTKFGFFIKSYNFSNHNQYKKVYSHKELNDGKQPRTSYFDTEDADPNTGKPYTFIGFEDGVDSYKSESSLGCDMDLNDFIIKITPKLTPVVFTEQSCIVAAEDLGAIGDFDFNDLVFSVSYTTGTKKATITPLAAGGTLPIYLCYKGTVLVDPKSQDRFHSWFGDGGIADGTMINTGSGATAVGNPVDIEVDANFTMADVSKVIDNKATEVNMGDFSVKVGKSDGTVTTVSPPATGSAPQMICVPTGWKWPKERVNITEAYEKFGEWGADYTKTDWYTTPTDEKYVYGGN